MRPHGGTWPRRASLASLASERVGRFYQVIGREDPTSVPSARRVASAGDRGDAGRAGSCTSSRRRTGSSRRTHDTRDEPRASFDTRPNSGSVRTSLVRFLPVASDEAYGGGPFFGEAGRRCFSLSRLGVLTSGAVLTPAVGIVTVQLHAAANARMQPLAHEGIPAASNIARSSSSPIPESSGIGRSARPCSFSQDSVSSTCLYLMMGGRPFVFSKWPVLIASTK